MPRKEPSTQIDILGKPDATPENDVSKFIESKISNEMYNIMKTPVWDSVGESLENFYLGARMEHRSMMRQHAVLMEQQRVEDIQDRNRIQRLNETQTQLRNRFVKVNAFLRQFEEKRKSATKKGSEELAIHSEIRSASEKIRSDLSELTEFRDQIKATSEEYEPYERVLEEVVQQSPAFNSVKELMDRCDALMLAQVEIGELGNKKVGELEVMRKRLIAVANEAALQVLGLKNALSSADRIYDAARTESLKWEKTLGVVKDTINEGVAKKDITYDGVNNTYRLLCQRRSLYPALKYEAVEDRLEFIREEVETLQEVLYVFEKRRIRIEDTKSQVML